MNILLINPPNIEEPEVEAGPIPIGLVSLREYLSENAINVTTLNLFPCKSWKEVRDKLDIQDYELVGIPCYTRQRFSVFELARLCKELKENIKVVLVP